MARKKQYVKGHYRKRPGGGRTWVSPHTRGGKAAAGGGALVIGIIILLALASQGGEPVPPTPPPTLPAVVTSPSG